MVQVAVKNLAAEEVGTINLADEVFDVDVRADILHRVVQWQLAKRRAGTHKVKVRNEVRGSTKKLGNQKGGGRARHGSKRVNIFRGGGVAFGPVPRDHSHGLTKKVRRLGLCCALSAKAKEGKLLVLDEAKLDSISTKSLRANLEKLDALSACVIDTELDNNFSLSSRNLPLVDMVAECGANVYDILRRDTLVLTKSAADRLQARLTGQVKDGAAEEQAA
jgi:large subunit ribosomal protein L4